VIGINTNRDVFDDIVLYNAKSSEIVRNREAGTEKSNARAVRVSLGYRKHSLCTDVCVNRHCTLADFGGAGRC
jgi:hypothetical protein